MVAANKLNLEPIIAPPRPNATEPRSCRIGHRPFPPTPPTGLWPFCSHLCLGRRCPNEPSPALRKSGFSEIGHSPSRLPASSHHHVSSGAPLFSPSDESPVAGGRRRISCHEPPPSHYLCNPPPLTRSPSLFSSRPATFPQQCTQQPIQFFLPRNLESRCGNTKTPRTGVQLKKAAAPPFAPETAAAFGLPPTWKTGAQKSRPEAFSGCPSS
ncbi:hypothetical protein VUR80DRAFT_4635 [Thermomyces stellatus]